MCTIQQATALFGMYQEFCQEVQEGTVARDFCKGVINGLAHGTKWYKPPLKAEDLLGLKVELPIERIKEIFEQHRVIVLRDPEASKSLLIGCGNSPLIYSSPGHSHDHVEHVTIDCDIRGNPTVVGAFGTQASLHAFLPKKHYTALVNELSPVARTADDIAKNALDCMADDFKCYEIKRDGSLVEEESFRKSKIFDENALLY